LGSWPAGAPTALPWLCHTAVMVA